MALLGTVIKKGIEFGQKLTQEKKKPHEQQQEQLKHLISTAKNTAFGKYYGFSDLLHQEDLQSAFKERIPIFDYNQMHAAWWKQQQQFPDITWPGKPHFFALSSGTTGKSSKHIPVTEDFLKSMRKVGLSMLTALPEYDFDEELYESEILMLSSSANLTRQELGFEEGEISGINVSNFPGWYDFFYRPGKQIASIDNWDEKVEAIAKEAPNWNIGAIAGIPSWVLLMLKGIIAYHDLKTIHDIWPNLTVYASGGVAFETYRHDFNKLTNKPLVIMDTYLASEGFLAYTAQPGAMDMRLALEHGYYYEFIPFDDRGVDRHGNLLQNPLSLGIKEVELDEEYVLVLSTCAGAWRYTIGDTIKFTKLDPPEILLTGRTKFYLNVVGSQLSEEKMDAAILEVAKDMDVSVNEYSVAAVRQEDGNYIHQWVIVTENRELDNSLFAERLDAALKNSNKNYGVAREKALKGISVLAISKDQYLTYLEKRNHLGGQVKTPKVMGEEDMKALLKHLGRPSTGQN